MTKDSKNNKNSIADSDFIEFVLVDEPVSSAEFIRPEVEPQVPVFSGTLEPSATLDDMPPVFRELAQPKLPALEPQNRARLLMQTPNRLFFYWSVGSNPFQKLNAALGSKTADYTLVLKLIDVNRDTEQVYRADAEGSFWFDVEAAGEYRAEIGFYAPSRPYVRALFSNTIATPRKSPSPRVDTERDWSISSDRFARVLEVAGFEQDAFDVAIAGDDPASADVATHAALAELVDQPDLELDNIASDEIRHAMLLIASGVTLDALRWKISPALFAELQKHAATLSSEKAARVLQERFEIDSEDVYEEETGPAVFGSSVINFPKRLRTRRTLPKLHPVSSLFRVPPSGGLL